MSPLATPVTVSPGTRRRGGTVVGSAEQRRVTNIRLLVVYAKALGRTGTEVTWSVRMI
jgi:hypothetical protein